MVAGGLRAPHVRVSESAVVSRPSSHIFAITFNERRTPRNKTYFHVYVAILENNLRLTMRFVTFHESPVRLPIGVIRICVQDGTMPGSATHPSPPLQRGEGGICAGPRQVPQARHNQLEGEMVSFLRKQSRETRDIPRLAGPRDAGSPRRREFALLIEL